MLDAEVSNGGMGRYSIEGELGGVGLNGNGDGFGYDVVEGSTNGSLEEYLKENGASNGSLVKYEDGNGAAPKGGDEASEETKRKKRVEEIGKEDAWFKKGGQEVQVNCLAFLFP